MQRTNHYKANAIESVIATIRYMSRWPRSCDDVVSNLDISRATFMRHIATARELFCMTIVVKDGLYYVTDCGIFDRDKLVFNSRYR
jgi:hypothetical protein